MPNALHERMLNDRFNINIEYGDNNNDGNKKNNVLYKTPL
jgi:hypothetical protein